MNRKKVLAVAFAAFLTCSQFSNSFALTKVPINVNSNVADGRTISNALLNERWGSEQDNILQKSDLKLGDSSTELFRLYPQIKPLDELNVHSMKVHYDADTGKFHSIEPTFKSKIDFADESVVDDYREIIKYYEKAPSGKSGLERLNNVVNYVKSMELEYEDRPIDAKNYENSMTVLQTHLISYVHI